MDQEKIGRLIKKIRQDHNLTQKELADQLGVTYQAVSKWENGKNVPDIAILKKISEDYHINIEDMLEGKTTIKKKSNYKYQILTIVLILLLMIVILLLIHTKQDSNFEFKTISSQCVDFKISGSAAYNKQKATIYISSIEFCGEEDSKYKQLDCTLYEQYQDTRTKISSCETKKNMNLETYLKGMNIHVENFSSNCKQLTTNSLVLEIQAITEDNKTVVYKVPIKLNDSCK